jgi:hypothetical protein
VDEDNDAALITKPLDDPPLENSKASVVPLDALATDNKLLDTTVELLVVQEIEECAGCTGIAAGIGAREKEVADCIVLVRRAPAGNGRVADLMAAEERAEEELRAVEETLVLVIEIPVENGFTVDKGAAPDSTKLHSSFPSKRTLLLSFVAVIIIGGWNCVSSVNSAEILTSTGATAT